MNKPMVIESKDITPIEQAPGHIGNVLSMVERVMASPDTDMSKLEKAMDLMDRMMAKQAQQQFYAAKASMQAQLPIIKKTGEIRVRGDLRSKYAKYEDIKRELDPLLGANGFSTTFETRTENGMLVVTGRLTHVGGHHEELTLPLPFDDSGSKNNVQAIGSSISYGKRYCLTALVDVAVEDEDNDAQTADAKPLISVKQFDELTALAALKSKSEGAILKLIHSKFGDSPPELSMLFADHADFAISRLKKLEAQNAGA